ncbi:MAG: hypothetical protein ACLFPJ_04860 [Candidatus Woesearchaeota archaeon]
MDKILTQKDRKKRLSVLKKVINSNTPYFKYISKLENDSYFKLETDSLFLEHVLNSVDININSKNRRIYEELENWDRRYLVNLCDNLENLIDSNENKEKLKYIITKSMENDLTESLARANLTDKFSKYNIHVLNNLEKLNINVENWLDKTKRIHLNSLNPNNYFGLKIKKWSQDFRTSYSIGNISDCCISFDKNKEFIPMKPVLLDYFLDLSVQIAHLRRIKGAEKEEKIGQIYFLGLNCLHPKKKQKNFSKRSCLGLTSVEIKNKYKKDLDLVPLISESIMGYNGFKNHFNYDSALFGHRFNLFDQYIISRKNEIKGLIHFLKQKRQNYTAIRRDLKHHGHEINEISDKIKSIDEEIPIISEIVDDIYKSKKYFVNKIGLIDAINANESYLGTNYLDLFQQKSQHDGFFNAENKKYQVEGYLLNEVGIFEKIEKTLNYLNQKYKKKK